MRDRNYLLEFLIDPSNPFGLSSSFGFTSDSSYGAKLNTDDSEYDIELTKDGAYISFEVPGYTKDNLQIVLENKDINITGKRVFNKKGETKTVKHNFKLSNHQVNESNIEATVSNGILTLFIPNYVEIGKKTINIL